MKKWTRALLALFLMATISLGSVLPAQAVYFKDVTRSDLGSELFDSINYVSDNGIIVGAYSDTYSPNASLTRAMVVAILYRWSGDGGSYSNPFTDVSRSDYYYDAVGWAYQNGIVYGTTNTQFSPGNPVTKEQFFAFLYRYAKIYNSDKTDYASTSISGHPDYSQVEEYAKIPLRWAKGHHVLKLTPTESIYPKLAVSRKYAAAFITRYSMQIKGFDYSSRFKFINSSNNFHTEVILNSNIKAKLENSINIKFSKKADIDTCTKILATKLTNGVGGHCNGMCMAMYFDKVGKIDFNQNTCNATTMSAVSVPKLNSVVESVINYYQIVQSFPGWNQEVFTSDDANLKAGAEAIYNVLRNTGPVLMGFTWLIDPNTNKKDTSAHRVIAISCTKTIYTSGKIVYSLTYYDPNETTLVTKPLEYQNGKISFYGKDIVGIYYLSPDKMDFWDIFDFDGAYNTGDMTLSTNKIAESDYSSQQAVEQPETVTLLTSSVAFTVENAQGQQLHYNGQTFTGEIDVICSSIVETTPGEPYWLSITVPYSNSFTYTPMSDRPSEFTVCAGDYYGGIAGTGIEKVSVDKASGIMVNGNNMQLSVYGSLKDNNYQYFRFDGKAEKAVNISYDSKDLSVSGMTGEAVIYQKDTFAEPDVLCSFNLSADPFLIDRTLYGQSGR